MSSIALILAGGSGSRSGLSIPKQMHEIRDIPLIARTISRFNRHLNIDRIVIVSRKENLEEIQSICRSYAFDKCDAFLEGGDTRQESSFNGITGCRGKTGDIVLIHDGARPFISDELISRCITGAHKHGASLAAVSPTDTILSKNDGFISGYLERDTLICAQTPQSFRFEVIEEAHRRAIMENFRHATDDTILVTRLGLPCAVVEGDRDNIKLTYFNDFIIADEISERYPV